MLEIDLQVTLLLCPGIAAVDRNAPLAPDAALCADIIHGVFRGKILCVKVQIRQQQTLVHRTERPQQGGMEPAVLDPQIDHFQLPGCPVRLCIERSQQESRRKDLAFRKLQGGTGQFPGWSVQTQIGTTEAFSGGGLFALHIQGIAGHCQVTLTDPKGRVFPGRFTLARKIIF